MPMLLPKPRPAVFDKRDQQREKLNHARSIAAQVNARDGRICRCCGRPSKHQHHIQYRSRGGPETTQNKLCLCEFCHALIHAKQLWIVGENADKRLRFEIHEAAVVDVFGTKQLPRDVRMIVESRR